MRRRPSISTLYAAATISILVLLAAGCDNTQIDPFIEGEHFTIWGYISEFADTHYVRVIPVRRFPEEISRPGDPHAEIDATVTSTEVLTGRTTSWRHTLRRLDDGSYGHVFSASFPVKAGARYQLTVTRSDGAESVAETVVPSGATAEVLPAVVDGDHVTQTIRWKDVPTPENMNVVYCAGILNSGLCLDGTDGGGLVIPYGRQGVRVGNDWEVTVELSRDINYLRVVSQIPPDQQLGLFSIQMRLNALDEEWVVLSDANEFAQPSSLDNVEGGFGFWGSIGNSILDWVPDEAALAAMGLVAQEAERQPGP